MIVGIDGRSLVGGGARGVALYTATVLEELARSHPEDEWRVLLPRGEATVPLGVRAVRSRLPGRALYGLGALAGRPRVDELLGGIDVLWVPAPAPLAASAGVPVVLTLHDLSWVERPRDFTPYERAWHRLARPEALAEAAARVIAVSEATAAAARAHWGLGTVVIRSGAGIPGGDVQRGADEVRRLGLPARYFLFVGALEPRKAPGLLVEAFGLARERGLDAELVLAGAGRLERSLLAPGVRVLGRLDRDSLAGVYAAALALVQPSWLEGFGLPPLEALAFGVPTVGSDIAVLRETLGDGALRVTPGDADGLASALLAVASDPALRSRLVEAGRQASAGLSWERCAAETYSVLREAAA